MFAIWSRNKATKVVGHGNPIFTKEAARDIAEYMPLFPFASGFDYWADTVPPTEPNPPEWLVERKVMP